MNERLTIQDLTDLLAAKHSMTKKDAEAFVKEFFLLIEQALESDNAVKIKGLGTFRLIDVDSRESVNVNTGERFQINGHTKVSFTPDTSLRDVINKPFAHFETVVLNENTILEDTPVEETEEEEIGEENSVPTLINEKEEIQNDDATTKIHAIIDENGSEPQETALQEEQVIEQSVTEQQPILPIKEKAMAEEIIEKELLKANLKSEVSKEKTAILIKATQTVASNTNTKTPSQEKSPVSYLIAVIILVLLLCGGVILFIYYPDLFSSSSDNNNPIDRSLETTLPIQSETQLTDTIEYEYKDSIEEATPDSIPSAVVAPQQHSTPVYLDSISYKITGTKTQYTIKEGETLTRVSLRFYGTKAMWPYIVKHNPNTIKNPNNVPYGTTIKIPELTNE